MQIETVQKWVMSTLLLTTFTVFSGGLTFLAAAAEGSSRPGLLVVAGFCGLLGMVGVRIINQKSPLTPWLLVGLVPAFVGWYFIYQR